MAEATINCCGVLLPTPSMERIADAFMRAQSIYQSLVPKAIAQDVYGLEGCAFASVS